MAKKRPSRKKKPIKAKSKLTARKKSAPRRKPTPRRKPLQHATANPGRRALIHQGVGIDRADEAGQSGDVQGLSGVEDVDSESVEELTEEGNSFEAEVVSGVENAPEPDQAEVRTKEVPEDDVPSEYRNYREQG
jgi:hypothetical protein